MMRDRLWFMMAFMFIGVFTVVQFILWRRNEAEGRLQEFYGAIALERWTESRLLIDKAIRLCPRDARFQAWKGFGEVADLRMECGGTRTDTESEAIMRAIEAYSLARSLNTNDPIFPYNLAWLHHLLGRNGLALVEFENAVTLNANDALFHASFAMFLEEIGRWDYARREYRNAVALSPELVDSQLFRDLSRRKVKEGREVIDDAVQMLEHSHGQTRSPVILARLGSLYSKIGDPGRARQNLVAALADLPNMPLAWVNLGDLYLSSGDRMAALHCYRRGVYLGRQFILPNLRLGEWYYAEGDQQSAFSYFDAATRNWERSVPARGLAARSFRMYRRSRQPLSNLLPPLLDRYASSHEIAKAFAPPPGSKPENSRASEFQAVPCPHAGLR